MPLGTVSHMTAWQHSTTLSHVPYIPYTEGSCYGDRQTEHCHQHQISALDTLADIQLSPIC